MLMFISVINLDASNITSGSLKVGGTSEPSYIELANSTDGTSGKLRWETREQNMGR